MTDNQRSDVPSVARPKYAMVYGDGQEVLTDSAAELITILIPDYPQPGTDLVSEAADAATLARIDFVTQIAAVVQHAALQGAADAGSFDPNEQDDDVLTELMKDRRIPFGGLSGDPANVRWDSALPLILVATDYHPFTDRPRPTGNVTLLDGSTEEAFLTTVSRVGIVDVSILAPASHHDR